PRLSRPGIPAAARGAGGRHRPQSGGVGGRDGDGAVADRHPHGRAQPPSHRRPVLQRVPARRHHREVGHQPARHRDPAPGRDPGAAARHRRRPGRRPARCRGGRHARGCREGLGPQRAGGRTGRRRPGPHRLGHPVGGRHRGLGRPAGGCLARGRATMPEHYDVIMIGSGAGGGTLTWALAPTGKRILLLERGGWLPREKENWSSVAVWGDKRYRNSGPWQDGDGKEFLPKQHYYVGGNTKFYGAILFRMRERDFGAIRHVDGVSPAWPLTSADWDPWYTQAERLYSVHGQRGLDPTEPATSADYPWPAISHEPRIEQLSADLTKAGL